MADVKVEDKGSKLEVNFDVDDVNPSDATTISPSYDDSVTTSGADAVVQEVEKSPSVETIPAVHSYQIKPLLTDKFKAGPVKEIIRNVLTTTLGGKSYNADSVKRWTVDIANEISTKVIELKMKRYKHIVQVILGEYKGAGVKSGVRCLWDSDTDGYTSDLFSNDTIFCVAVVYAVYLY